MPPAPPPEDARLFHLEYERELDEWLRRRFGYLCIAFAIIELFGVAVASVAYAFSSVAEAGTLRQVAFLSAMLALVGLVGTAFFYRSRGSLDSRSDVLQAATRLILLLGGLALVELALQRVFFGQPGYGALPELFMWHFAASLFLPWRPTESLRPMIPLLIAWAALTVLLAPVGGRLDAAVAVLFSPAILVPGMAVSTWRLRSHGQRFRSEMVGKQFHRLRTELMQARTVHESMFPARHDDGYVRLDYEYEPMRDVGGDYIHLAVGPTGTISVTVIDVTGHGLAAAMTVNRLFGELERVRAEHPQIQPVQVLTALNRYIHLTLSRHNIYATAVCLDIDPYVGAMRYANAGHPPVFIRTATGPARELESTGMLLGVVPDESFDCEQATYPLVPGDTVIVFTDGLIEAMNRRGELFGVARVRDALRRTPAPGNWPQFLTSLASRHQSGPSQDDMLVAAIRLLNVRVGRARLELAKVGA